MERKSFYGASKMLSPIIASDLGSSNLYSDSAQLRSFVILRGFRTIIAGAFPKPYSAWGFTSRTLIRDRDYGHSALDSIELQPIG